MDVLNDNEITFEDCSKLRKIFEDEGIKVEPPKCDGSYDDHVVASIVPQGGSGEDDAIRVIMWPAQRNNEVILFRVILIKNNKIGKSLEGQFTSEQWDSLLDAILCNCQNFEFFGHVALRNFLGVTLEYGLDTTGGILTHNIVNAARKVALGAWIFRNIINKNFDFLN